MAPPALLRHFPQLAGQVPHAMLGCWPTPVTAITILERRLWIKREDLSSPGYGGNKIRTLEVLLPAAARRERLWTLGCYGSNHALAAAIHAVRLKLRVGALLVPQPSSATARDNLAVLLGQPGQVWTPSWLGIPGAGLALLARVLRGNERWMMPGGASPLGALGHVGAGLELAEQINAGCCPAPHTIVLPYGSGCTTAGLLVGIALARQQGLGYPVCPRLLSVRISPWPITARWWVTRLARRTAALLRRLLGIDLRAELAAVTARLQVSSRWLGRGYGHVTPAGLAAIECFDQAGFGGLDTTYSAKAGAAVLDILPQVSGEVLYWFTKSSCPLPGSAPSPDRLSRRMSRWLEASGLDPST